MEERYLDLINSPADLKRLSVRELKMYADEIRCFLIETISKTGGHIGTNLGVVELTIGLHYVFSMPHDKIIFDTGHQGYTHKIITGRRDLFKTLNQPFGMSRFLTRMESSYDLIDASHAGTAVSIASGYALKKLLKKTTESIIAVVGDGALVEGMSSEALNYIVEKFLPMIVVINDNGMSIPVNVGGIKNLFSGQNWEIKSKYYFEGLGYQYLSVEDGHNIESLVKTFQEAKMLSENNSVIVHVKTEKGKGLEIAKKHKYKMHFSMPFDPVTGEGSSPVPTGRTYATVAGEKLCKLMGKESDIVVITPSTPYASGLDSCAEFYPERTIDVGMAEQQAVGLAVGLAMSGMKPFVCYQATFMQRAFDQIFHDIAFMNLPVTILGVRSGFAGFDSPTHHGIYDLSYLRAVPNLKIFYPGTSYELEKIIEQRSLNPDGPMLILYPYEGIRKSELLFQPQHSDVELAEVIQPSKTGYIISVGNTLEAALEFRKLLATENVDFGLINIRWINPLPIDQLKNLLATVKYVVTTEENVLDGGFGSSIAELLLDNELGIKLFRSGIDRGFVETGDKQELSKKTRIDAISILKNVKKRWSELF